MSVITTERLHREDMLAEARDFDEECFLCGEKLALLFVFWQGYGKSICLHGGCAGEFAQKLLRDHRDFLQLC